MTDLVETHYFSDSDDSDSEERPRIFAASINKMYNKFNDFLNNATVLHPVKPTQAVPAKRRTSRIGPMTKIEWYVVISLFF